MLRKKPTKAPKFPIRVLDDVTFEAGSTAFEMLAEASAKKDLELIKFIYPRASKSIKKAVNRLEEIMR